MVIPWYFNFFLSWRDCNQKLLVTYEDLNREPIGTFSRILDYCEIDASPAELDQVISAASGRNTRKNVGKIGRGTKLNPKTRERILDYARYYDNVDFSEIGLPPD